MNLRSIPLAITRVVLIFSSHISSLPSSSISSPSLLFIDVLDCVFFFSFSQLKKHDGTALQWHVKCATEFKKCYIIWRTPMTGVLSLCHPDTIKVIQSGNAPKSFTYKFSKPFLGESWFSATSFPRLFPYSCF